MYKLMLVEDEAVVRESIRQNIDWGRYGFTLCCACENGREALERLDTLMPDVVVTDICMPFVDGLELTRYLHEHYPSVLVVILTGFSEFSYAQQAVKLHVHDFLLKPVVPKEFCAILEKLAADLRARDSQRSNLRSLQSRAYQAETILRSALFRNLLRGLSAAGEIRRQAREAGLSLDCASYAAIFCRPLYRLHSAAELQRLQDAAQATASRFPHCTAAVVDELYAVLLVGGRTADEVSRRSRDAGAMLCDAVGRACGAEAQAGLGGCAAGLGGLHRTFREACHALGYGFTVPYRVIADHQARAAERPATEASPLPSVRGWIQSLAGGEDALERLDALFDTLVRRNLHRDACVPLLERLRFAMADLIPEERRSAAPQIPPPEDWFRIRDVQKDFRQLAAFLLRAPDEEDPARRCVESAKGYILQRYHDSAFSLTELLSLLNVSKSYFSSAFKAQTGQTFLEYLTAMRMEKARQLLATTNLPAAEIAERIGFTDPHYFSVVFKRAVGKTPREFRESVQ